MATAPTTFLAVGRRKSSTARVQLRPGNGRITVNGRELEDYFPRASLRTDIARPLVLTDSQGQLDVFINVAGGGSTGQAGACRLGIARALTEWNLGLRPVLKRDGLLTRDARKVERKKYGRAGARASFQFSKR